VKALVLAGGEGTRLRPLSYAMPKQVIPVANRPVLAHVLANIADLGVADVGVIVGDRATDIMSVMGDGADIGVRITYLRQDRPRGLAHCVQVAQDFLGDDDFVMYLGDNMLPDGIAALADTFRRRRPAAQVAVYKVADPSRFGVVELDGDGAVARLVEKPAYPRSDLALIGVYFFTAAVHEAVRSIAPSPRGELEITDALQWLLTHGAVVEAREYEGLWMDVGSVDDVLECNRLLLDRSSGGIHGYVDAASEVRGAVTIAAGATVRRSRLVGPVVIGAGCLIEDCEIGPYTSIGADCVVRGTRLTGSVVLDGAAVRSSLDVAGSLIGRHATVDVAHRARSDVQLVVGDHTRIARAR
jgi:glucose-1-phosphate thymidylyltransferase